VDHFRGLLGASGERQRSANIASRASFLILSGVIVLALLIRKKCRDRCESEFVATAADEAREKWRNQACSRLREARDFQSRGTSVSSEECATLSQCKRVKVRLCNNIPQRATRREASTPKDLSAACTMAVRTFAAARTASMPKPAHVPRSKVLHGGNRKIARTQTTASGRMRLRCGQKSLT